MSCGEEKKMVNGSFVQKRIKDDDLTNWKIIVCKKAHLSNFGIYLAQLRLKCENKVKKM